MIQGKDFPWRWAFTELSLATYGWSSGLGDVKQGWSIELASYLQEDVAGAARSREGNALRINGLRSTLPSRGEDRRLRAWGTPLEGNGSISADRTGARRKFAKIIRGSGFILSILAPSRDLQSANEKGDSLRCNIYC